MNGTITIQVKKNDFGKISQGAVSKTRDILDKASLDVIAEAEPFTRRDTGNLIGSANVKSGGEFLRIVFWGAEYAIFQDKGTRFISGTFFAEKGADQVRPGFIDAMKEIWKP